MLIRIIMVVIIIGIIYFVIRKPKKEAKEIKKTDLPTEATMLGLRIGGIIDLKIGAESFLLLSDNMCTNIEDRIFVIDKISSFTANHVFSVVRAYCGKYLFQFNISNHKLNDILVFVKVDTLPLTSHFLREFDNITDYFKYEDYEFDSEGFFTFYEKFSSGGPKTSIEKLFIRKVNSKEDIVEYALIKKDDEINVYTGVVIDEKEIGIT